MNRALSMLMVSAALGAGCVYAQQHRLTAKIPFPFHAGKTLMPAGTYQVEESVSRSLVTITSEKRDVGVMLLAVPSEANKAPQVGSLLFNKYGESYFLARISKPGDARGWVLPRTRAELEVAKARTEAVIAQVPAHAH